MEERRPGSTRMFSLLRKLSKGEELATKETHELFPNFILESENLLTFGHNSVITPYSKPTNRIGTKIQSEYTSITSPVSGGVT